MLIITSVIDFFQKDGLKSKATSITKIQKILSFLDLSDVGIFLRGGPFPGDWGIFNLHPTTGMHWICYKGDSFFVFLWMSSASKKPLIA